MTEHTPSPQKETTPSQRAPAHAVALKDIAVEKQDSSPTEHVFHVQIPAHVMTQRLDERIKQHAQTIKLKGFRPGKIPLHVIKQRYAKTLYQELTEQTCQHVTQHITQNYALVPLTSPHITHKRPLAPETPLDMEIRLQTAHIPTISYDAIAIERYNPTAPTPQDVHHAMTALKAQHPQYEDAPTHHHAQQGDRVSIDATITPATTQKQDKAPATTQKGTWHVDLIDITDSTSTHHAQTPPAQTPPVQTPSSPMPLWRQQIIRTLMGKRVGDSFDLTTHVPPSDSSSPTQNIHIRGHVVSLRRPRPCHDDDLVRILQAQSRDDLDGKLHALLTQKGIETRNALLSHALRNALQRHVSVELPERYVHDATKECSSPEQKNRLTQQLRLSALYRHLAQQHRLYASKEDVEKHMRAILNHRQEPLSDEETYELTYRLSLSITEHHVENFILKHVRIRDISLPFHKLMAIPNTTPPSEQDAHTDTSPRPDTGNTPSLITSP
ncbi:MAG: hypothetical protein GDA54_00070 [Alphaproteobacteria bacterium GM7ARS4]|nr:hypothetical protein [Alphaproteobacteria bacterium GM7ARS4]